ncbi:ORF6N domain-containing protein [Massilia sp. TN1-12]|uniref:ORF6N domain-containing protein n=1 Tax=Massilia paldalensis TaxID=3377675 RepID=UPI0038516FFB
MTAIITVGGVALTPIEYRGVRVMTLAMMDAVHKRPDDTARRNFNKNRARLIGGEDFHEINQPDEIRTLGFSRPQGGTPEKVILVTETGYSMLVKSFNDDLAWDVQRQLVKSYFGKHGGADTHAAMPPPQPARRTVPRLLTEINAIDLIGDMVAKVPGTRADVVAAIKLRMIEQRTGIPVTQFQSALPAEAIEKAVKLNPTAIGKRLTPKMSPAQVNKTLIRLGLQRKTEKGHVLTEAGSAYGESRPYQAENMHVGDQINWYESVVAVVQGATEAPPTNHELLLGFVELSNEVASGQHVSGGSE